VRAVRQTDRRTKRANEPRRQPSVWRCGPSNVCGRRRSAFTLLEVTIACVLLATIAGIATLSLRGQVSANRLQQALEQLERADRFARQLARRTGSNAFIEFDDADSEIRIAVDRRTQKTYGLPPGSTIANVRVAKTNARDVGISPLGQSTTYAIEFADGERQTRWLVVAGTSGHTLRTSDKEQVNALLRF